uniref:Uncharacterized protein n=1 Tax=Arundo donax TaxID=35708 RepID=A0A0A9HVA6_ARUDO
MKDIAYKLNLTVLSKNKSNWIKC